MVRPTHATSFPVTARLLVLHPHPFRARQLALVLETRLKYTRHQALDEKRGDQYLGVGTKGELARTLLTDLWCRIGKNGTAIWHL